MKKILVPTDFSPEADKVLDAVRDLALKAKAEIIFLHVIRPLDGFSLNFGGMAEQEDDTETLFMVRLKSQAEKQLNLRALSSRFIDVTTRIELIVDDFFNAVQQIVKSEGIDLIVMGSKGSTGMDELLVGSNAERIVRYATCPVLIIKEAVETFNVESIAFATNCDDNAVGMVNTLKQFQAMFGTKLHLVNINTPNNFYRTRVMIKMLEEFALRHGIENFSTHVYSDTTEEDGVVSFADDIQADMIAITTHGRTGLARMLSGSIASEVVNHAKRPVLTYKVS